MTRPGLLFCLIFQALLPSLVEKAEGQQHGSKQMTAVAVDPGEIRLDGRLDEAAWERATAIDDFVQKEPVEGVAPTERTEVRIVYTPEALYVGARMYSKNGGESIQAPLSRRDEGFRSELLYVSLDTYLDLQSAYSFAVTASGVRLDHYNRSDDEYDRDFGFNPVWEAETQIDAEGWTAEMRIPFSQLRFNRQAEQVFGINFNRWIPATNEDIYWIPVPRTEQAWSSYFGLLTGIRNVAESRRVELLPYVAGGSSVNGRRDVDDPFDDGRNLEARFGGDLKMGIGPNLTLDATVLPDFGQVEADPAVVNLTAIETFYEERRPFFTEGIRLIGGDINNYFYSRRIGAPPSGSVSADYVDYPANARILGAAKLTGRLASGTSIGVLGAVTGDEYARTFDLDTDTFGRVRVAPISTWGVGRIQQEIGTDGSTVAFLVSGVRRDVEPDEPLADLVTRDAISVAAESLWRLGGGTYELGVSGGLSHVDGEETAIERLQRASTRYFQRPDATHVTFDPTRTSLDGFKATVQGRKIAGEHWLWNFYLDAESPSVEFNDIGRLGAADGYLMRQGLTWRETVPGSFFRNYRFSLDHSSEWNFGLERLYSRLSGSTNWTWNNFWSTNLSAEWQFRGNDWQLTRGGPTMVTPQGWNARANLRSSFTTTTTWNVNARYSSDELGGWSRSLGGNISMLPTPRLELSLGPSIDQEVNPRQYVAFRPGGSPATYGGRYIFAYIDRTTLALETRLNFTLRPDVNLDLYAQPFAASGRYHDFGELEAAGSLYLREYGTDGTTIGVLADGSREVMDGGDAFSVPNRDFNLRSFRSTSVLRWEWQPGSTLYLVWQQDRSNRQAIGRAADLGDVIGSLGAVGNNYFAIKASYWLGL